MLMCFCGSAIAADQLREGDWTAAAALVIFVINAIGDHIRIARLSR